MVPWTTLQSHPILPLFAFPSLKITHRLAGRARKLFFTYFVGVVLDDDLHRLLQDSTNRNALRQTIIETYFPVDRWLAIKRSPTAITDDELATSAYTHRLLDDSTFGGSSRNAEEELPYRMLRDASFRRAVTFAYDYRCAFCGVRLKSPRDHILVEAAHIVPWHKTHDDRPVNGLCLCPLCHWAFDARMLAVDIELNILTHAGIQVGANLPGHLATLVGRPIYKPKEDRFLPDQNCLKEQLVEFELT